MDSTKQQVLRNSRPGTPSNVQCMAASPYRTSVSNAQTLVSLLMAVRLHVSRQCSNFNRIFHGFEFSAWNKCLCFSVGAM